MLELQGLPRIPNFQHFFLRFHCLVFNFILFFIAMEGLEVYDVVEDVEIEVNEVIEDNILDNEDIDIDYDVLIDEDVVDGNVQEFGDVNSLEGDTHLHLS
jgi:hypothetical protein